MALSRTTDPQTSHDAAVRVEASGKAGGQRAKCLAIVQNHPEGLTSKEVAAHSSGGMDRYTAAKRLPELRKAGLVCNDGERDGEMLWKPVFQPSWKPALKVEAEPAPSPVVQKELF